MTQDVKFYQTGTFAVGNRLLDPEQRTVQARTRALQLAHLGPPRLPGLRRGARRPLRARRRDAGDRRPAGRGQRHRLPRGVLDAVPRDARGSCRGCTRSSATRPAVATGVAAALQGARAATTSAWSPRAATAAPSTSASAACRGCSSATTTCSSSATTTRRYMNTGVQRSRRDAARRAHRHHQGRRRRAGQRLRPGQERAADRDGARDPLRRHRDRRRPARPRGQGRAAMELRGARYLHVFVPCPLGWGSASEDTIRMARLAKETGLFPVFEAEHGEVTARLEDPPAGAGRGVPEAAAALRPPVRRPAPRPTSSRGSRPIADRNIRRFGLLEHEEAAA